MLELPKTASQGEIRKQYLKLARQHHPDKVHDSQKPQAEESFRQISVAYETLTQPPSERSSSSHSQAYADPFSMFDQLFAQMRSSSGFFNDPFFGGDSMGGDSFFADPFTAPSHRRRDPFADMMGGGGFMGMGMGGMGMPSMMSPGGMGMGRSAGRSISTTVVNGRKETRETNTNSDGSSTTTITTPEGSYQTTQQAQLPQQSSSNSTNSRQFNALPSAYNSYWM